MKTKPVILNFLCCFFAVILVFGFSGALMAQQKATAKSQTTQQPSKPVKRDAGYWFTNFSGAYFSQGVSYGQLGQYQKAIAQINRALKMEPQNGMYYYGRGRVYLLSGDKTKAMEDFKKAADLQDEDALDYLDYINPDKK
jgi:tetratricopeptide (TPR) repeat protein